MSVQSASGYQSPPSKRVAQSVSREIAPKLNANSLIVGALAIAALHYGREVFVPLAIAVPMTFILAPFVRFLRNLYVPKSLAAITAICISTAALISGAWMIAQQGAILADNLPRYELALKEKARLLRGATLQSRSLERATETLQELGEELSAESSQNKSQAENVPPSKILQDPSRASETRPLPVEIYQPPNTIIETYEKVITTLIYPMAIIALVFIFTTFMLLQRQDLRDRFIRLVGAQDLERTTNAMAEAAQRLSRYLFLLTALNVTYGVAVGTALWFIGVPNPILWGGLACLMRYVPFIGSFIAAAFPLMLAAAVDPTWTMFLWTLALFGSGEIIMGQVVEPLTFGNSTGLSPLAIIISAAFWTLLWGPIGLLIATPLTLVLVVLGRHVEHLAFLDVILGDQPVLSPSEKLYQRMLADDPDEALEQAVAYLKDHTLVSYLDNVMVGALELANDDAKHGTYGGDQLSRIQKLIAELIEDLPDEGSIEEFDPLDFDYKTEKLLARTSSDPNNPQHEDAIYDRVLPVLTEADLLPQWKIDTPVLCVVGRNPLDMAAGEVLRQILSRHGLETKLIQHGDPAIDAEAKCAAVTILSFLGTKKRTARLRSISRRLKRNNDTASIIAARWSSDTQATTSEPNASSPDFEVSSFREALALCLRLATGRNLAQEKTATQSDDSNLPTSLLSPQPQLQESTVSE